MYPILFALHCRHLSVSLEMLLKLVKIFVPVIRSTLSAGPSVGVDLQAEQRFSFGVYVCLNLQTSSLPSPIASDMIL